MYKIGVIGSGHRMTPIVEKIAKNEGFKIQAVCDPNVEAMKEKYASYEDVHFYTDASQMLKNEKLDCLTIGTRCSLHTDFMLLTAKYGLPTFLEKPVCINEQQLTALEELNASTDISDKVVVSFPLRNTPIVNCVRDIIKSGKLGQVAHVQAYNNVPYARCYYHGWYRDENETGGLWLQKATHDFDYINSLLEGIHPVRICAVDSKQVFYGDMPENQKCSECPRAKECPESAQNVATYGDRYAVEDGCCFAVDTGNQDSGSAIVEYSNGMHAVYSQDFIARKGAGKRGARLIGYYGTVEFDFNTGVVQLYYHNSDATETYRFPTGHGHSGGDAALISNFCDVVSGKDISHSPLKEGILSAKMCLCAKKSAIEKVFCEIV